MLKDNLTKYREKKGYSKLYLSQKSGVSRERIKQIELIENQNVSIETLEKLARALDITVQDLIK
jgi:transcriptional regulator with XRE-family HTH domain